jgi:hypothetical protein
MPSCVRLAEVHRHQLRVAVGDVQQMDVAKARHIVEPPAVAGRERPAIIERHAGSRRDGERMKEFAAAHRHAIRLPDGANAVRRSANRCDQLLTGEAGSSSSATRSLICASVSTPW